MLIGHMTERRGSGNAGERCHVPRIISIGLEKDKIRGPMYTRFLWDWCPTSELSRLSRLKIPVSSQKLSYEEEERREEWNLVFYREMAPLCCLAKPRYSLRDHKSAPKCAVLLLHRYKKEQVKTQATTKLWQKVKPCKLVDLEMENTSRIT